MSALEQALLPATAAVSASGRLSIGGCDLVELAAELGTPLFVYDEDQLRSRCRDAVAAFGPGGASYATKAFLCVAMARLAHEEGMKLDVSTAGEYHIARAAGVPADGLILHGNNKSVDELSRAMTEGVSRIIVDSFDEMDRIEKLVADGLPVPTVLIRITPGIEAHTHEFVQTGQDDSKFGFGVHTGAAQLAFDRARSSTAMDLVGLHMHIGSQIFDAEFFERAVQVLAPWFHEHELPELSVGGGIGVPYLNGESAPTFGDWARAVKRAVADAGIAASVHAEPGRAIVAQAGVTLYTVGTVKDIPGIRTYVSVDGGMSDNPRPVLYGAGYEAFLPRDVGADRPRTVTVVGKHCESGDLLVRDAVVPADLAVGDILCTPVTGAYGHSMGSNYNKVTRPPVVFVRDGDARLVVRRETLDDLTRLDIG